MVSMKKKVWWKFLASVEGKFWWNSSFPNFNCILVDLMHMFTNFENCEFPLELKWLCERREIILEYLNLVLLVLSQNFHLSQSEPTRLKFLSIRRPFFDFVSHSHKIDILLRRLYFYFPHHLFFISRSSVAENWLGVETKYREIQFK